MTMINVPTEPTIPNKVVRDSRPISDNDQVPAARIITSVSSDKVRVITASRVRVRSEDCGCVCESTGFDVDKITSFYNISLRTCKYITVVRFL